MKLCYFIMIVFFSFLFASCDDSNISSEGNSESKISQETLVSKQRINLGARPFSGFHV
mgnify:CR=1 FL=1